MNALTLLLYLYWNVNNNRCSVSPNIKTAQRSQFAGTFASLASALLTIVVQCRWPLKVTPTVHRNVRIIITPTSRRPVKAVAVIQLRVVGTSTRSTKQTNHPNSQEKQTSHFKLINIRKSLNHYHNLYFIPVISFFFNVKSH